MGVGLLVGVWVARYLGPSQYGLLSYAMALVGLFVAFSTLGLQSIMVRDFVNHPENSHITLGSGFLLRLAGGFLTFVLVLAIISILKPEDTLSRAIVAILGFIQILKAGEVVKYWFESQVQSRFVVWIENGVFLISAVFKVGMILLHAPLLYFVWISFFEAFIVAVLYFVLYKWKVGRITFWKPTLTRSKTLLKDSWPLILSGFAVAIYMRIDQIMIGEMLGNKAVGIYSVAVQISEIWYFIPMAIVASVFPILVKTKGEIEKIYYAQLQSLYDLMIWLSIIIGLFMTFFSFWIINFFYGKEYIEAVRVLKILAWAGVNVALGAVWSKWILIENKQKISLLGHIIGAVLNIFFNFVLIKLHGIKGAAIATILSYWLSAFIVYALYKPSKSYGMFIKSFNIKRIHAFKKKSSKE